MVDPITAAPVAEPAAPVPEPQPAPSAPPAPSDPFSLDEARLSQIPAEHRGIFDEWKKKAQDEIQKSSKTYEDKYKPHVEKAAALEQLVKHPKFQEWWRSQQQQPQQQPTSQAQSYATPEEWSQAVIDASNGDPSKLQAINAKMISSMASPVVKQLQEKQQLLDSTLQMKSLFERHPDAKDLDAIGRDANDPGDQTPSLLEIAMTHAVDGQGKSVEEGYQLAKKWADAMGAKAHQAALGMVQAKKDSVTAPGSTSTSSGQSVVEVGSTDELITKNMEALLSEQKPPRFVVKR